MSASGKAEPLSKFNDVMARIFPLVADQATMQKFVDDYLNNHPYSGGNYFRVAMPLVFMELLDYGSMSGRLTGNAYTSQNELLFMIVLEWFEESSSGGFQFGGKRYKRHPQTHALVTPFIFVDNPLSVMAGRENFGWPKSLINVKPVSPGWAPTAGESSTIMRIGAMRLRQFYEGQSQRFSTILEIEKRAGYSDGTTGIPLDPMRAMSDWWSSSMRSFDSLVHQWRRIMDVQGASTSMMMQMMEQYRQTLSGNSVGTGSLANWFASLGNSIGVKHFRDSDNPDRTCFAALANMRTEVTRMYGAGLLGSMESQVSGLDGGFTIRAHRYQAYPALEKLGIAVTRTEQPSEPGNPPVDILTPLMPFWYRMDFTLMTSFPLSTEVHGEPVPARLREDQLPDYLPEFAFSAGQNRDGGDAA